MVLFFLAIARPSLSEPYDHIMPRNARDSKQKAAGFGDFGTLPPSRSNRKTQILHAGRTVFLYMLRIKKLQPFCIDITGDDMHSGMLFGNIINRKAQRGDSVASMFFVHG